MVTSSSVKSILPRFGLGMAAIGRPGYINLNRSEILGDASVRDVSFMQEAADSVMDEALQLGVTWFDCARSYGLSEKFVGDYLRSRKISSGEYFTTFVDKFAVDLTGIGAFIKYDVILTLE